MQDDDEEEEVFLKLIAWKKRNKFAFNVRKSNNRLISICT